MSGHLKRLAAPKSWKINRKANTFTAKPKPGAHSQDLALPLGVVLRDLLQYAGTAAEVTKLLHTKEVLVDGIRRKDFHLSVGLFDVITLKNINKHYRVIFDAKGRLDLSEISPVEAHLKLGKIVGKTIVSKGKIQYHLHDGKNILSPQQATVGDTFVLALPSLDVQEILPLKPGMLVFLMRGKHRRDIGVFKGVVGKEATYILDQKEVGTAREYLFVVGEKKPVITLT